MPAFLRQRIFANVTWGELIALLVAAFAAVWVCFPLIHFRGLEWDTLLYLNTAQAPGANAGILNRYTHIYLQKIFLLFFSPLDAAKAFWEFQIFGTGILVYLSAKMLNMRNTAMAGILALIFYFAQRELFIRSGVPLIDFTTMFLVMVAVFVYLVYLRSEKRSPVWLVLLGLLQFLLFKSKETGIIALVLLAGAILLSANSWRERGRSALFVTAGALAGVLLFIGLDGIFLGDPWFSLRPESWRALIDFNLALVAERAPESWFFHIFTTALVIPFLLAFLPFWQGKVREYKWPERLIWVLPLALVGLLCLAIFRASYPLNFRYLFPAIPIIAITGAQALQWRQENGNWRAWQVLGTSAAIAAFFFLVVYPFVASLPYWWTEFTFFSNIVTGLLLAAFFGVLLLEENPRLPRKLLLLSIIVVLLFTPVLNIPREMATAREASEYGFSPFSIYAQQIRVREGASLFFSSHPYEDEGVLGRNSGSSEYMFEAYFNVQVARADFSGDIQDFLLADYDYGFVTRAEFATAFIDDDLDLRGYVIFDDPASEVILIAKPPN